MLPAAGSCGFDASRLSLAVAAAWSSFLAPQPASSAVAARIPQIRIRVLRMVVAPSLSAGIRAGAVIPRRRGPGASMVVVIAVATRCGTEGSMPAPRARDKPSIVLRSMVLARGGGGGLRGPGAPGRRGAPPP